MSTNEPGASPEWLNCARKSFETRVAVFRLAVIRGNLIK